jgi:hypothetical protein
MGVGCQRHSPAALPPGKTRYLLYRRLCEPQGRSERMRKISPQTGFDPRTIQTVASCYTDWGNPARFNPKYGRKIFLYNVRTYPHEYRGVRTQKITIFTYISFCT